MSDTNKSEQTRLNKHLALLMGISRREADNLIASGRASINGKTAILGARFKHGDAIAIDDKVLLDNNKSQYQCIALNKPAGYVCSRKQQGDNPTIYDLIPNDIHHLKPVGRLDRESSGLILLTNDGDFAFKMTHPKFYKVKIYHVHLDKELAPLHQQMISDFGVELADGKSKLQLERQSETNRNDWIVTMHEGRNRQIRRTFDSLGYTVLRLHRTNFGSYALGDIKPGKYKSVNIL